MELATPTTATPSANTSGAGHPIYYTNAAGTGTVVTVMLDAVNASGASPSPPQPTPLLLEHVAGLAGPPPLDVAGGSNASTADVVLRIQNHSKSAPTWVLHFLTSEAVVVKLNPQYITASHIAWQYLSAGWNATLTAR